jgi:hypothetical protein
MRGTDNSDADQRHSTPIPIRPKGAFFVLRLPVYEKISTIAQKIRPAAPFWFFMRANL